ncbi:Homeobox protein KNOX3 [Hordeum vulgare]|nr:Homeobox protein KNOX3 [Hordeum vulgare]
MAERYPGDGVAANGFGPRHLREDEARLLDEADYPVPPDMRVPAYWRLSAGSVPVPPPPTGGERRAEIVHIWSGLRENSRNLLRYASGSNTLWTAYFERRHADQLASTNGVEPRGRHNSEGRDQWINVISMAMNTKFKVDSHFINASPSIYSSALIRL